MSADTTDRESPLPVRRDTSSRERTQWRARDAVLTADGDVWLRTVPGSPLVLTGDGPWINAAGERCHDDDIAVQHPILLARDGRRSRLH